MTAPTAADYPTPEDISCAVKLVDACGGHVKSLESNGPSIVAIVRAAAWRIRQTRLLREHPQYPTFLTSHRDQA